MPQIGAILPQLCQLPGAPGTLIADGSATARPVVGTYFCGTVPVAGTTQALSIASIANPAASGRRIFVLSTIVEATAAASAVSGAIQIGRTTGVPTGGTTETAQPASSSVLAPVAIVRSGPTATAASGRIGSTVSGILVGAREVANLINDADVSHAVQLAEGEALLVSAPTSSLNQTFVVNFTWIELGALV